MRKMLIIAICSVFLPLSSFAAQDYIGKTSGKGEVDPYLPVVTDHKIDLDGDKTEEIVKVIYGPGVSDKLLTIEVYRGAELVSVLKGDMGIQSNYKIEDVDKDGKQEIIIWSGLWDPRMPGEDGITESTYEGHSAPHRYVVATYKMIRGEYCLWDIYSTKKKYEPFCEEQPENAR